MKLFRRIFSGSCTILSSLLIVYVFFRSEIEYNGQIRDYYLIFYIISFFLLFFSIASFFFNKKILDYLIISSFSIIFSFYLFEGYMLFKNSYDLNLSLQSKILEYKKKTGQDYDKRSLIEIYLHSNKEENIFKVMTPPSNFILREGNLFPLSGISNTLTIHGNENGYFSKYMSDRYGFNNPDGTWDETYIEYLLIGDSFVHGAYVNSPNDIASQLRDISKRNVLNLGYSGKGPLMEYATLKEYIKPNTKKIVWFFFENDFKNLADEKSNKKLERYLADESYSQNLKERQDEIDMYANNYINEEVKRHNRAKLRKVSQFLKLSQTRIALSFKSEVTYSASRRPSKETLNTFKKIIRKTKLIAEKNNSEFYFVYLPSYEQLKKEEDEIFIYNMVKKIIHELKIPFIDINNKLFEKTKNPYIYFPFQQPGHYNVNGYKKISKIVYRETN